MIDACVLLGRLHVFDHVDVDRLQGLEYPIYGIQYLISDIECIQLLHTGQERGSAAGGTRVHQADIQGSAQGAGEAAPGREATCGTAAKRAGGVQAPAQGCQGICGLGYTYGLEIYMCSYVYACGSTCVCVCVFCCDIHLQLCMACHNSCIMDICQMLLVWLCGGCQHPLPMSRKPPLRQIPPGLAHRTCPCCSRCGKASTPDRHHQRPGPVTDQWRYAARGGRHGTPQQQR